MSELLQENWSTLKAFAVTPTHRVNRFLRHALTKKFALALSEVIYNLNSLAKKNVHLMEMSQKTDKQFMMRKLADVKTKVGYRKTLIERNRGFVHKLIKLAVPVIKDNIANYG